MLVVDGNSLPLGSYLDRVNLAEVRLARAHRRAVLGRSEEVHAMEVFLETERLLLRRFVEADADLLVDLDSDPAVMRFLSGGVATPRDVIVQEVLPRFLRSYKRYAGLGYWAAIEQATGAFIGWFAFHPHEGGPSDEVELGYRLRRAAWDQGYATEGARALIRKGFAELGVQRVVATTYQDNLASRRVMEKADLRLVRTFRITPAELAAAGTFQFDPANLWDGDDVEYALSRADWKRQEAGQGEP
jgi:RimJ/RimL family protein N-acetyltransferase